MVVKAQHALTRAEYHAEGPNSIRVVDGDRWGRFDRYGAWTEGEMRQCDPQLCIWLTGLFVVQARTNAPATPKEAKE